MSNDVAAELELHYSGPSEMDAATLARALLGLDSLVREAGKAGMFDGRIPDVKVRPPETGSFSITAIITGLGVVGTAVGTLSAIGKGVLIMRDHLFRGVRDFEHIAESGMVKVEFTDGRKAELTEAEWRLFNSKEAQKALKGIAAPVATTARSLEISSAGAQQVSITRDELPQLIAPPGPEAAPKRFTAWVSIRRVDFAKANGWRASSQGLEWTVTIEDKKFLERLESGAERIGKNDTFKVAMRVETTVNAAGKEKPRHFIERVMDHHVGTSSEQEGLPEA